MSSPYRTHLLALLSASLPSSGHFQVLGHHFYVVETRTAHNIKGEAPLMLNITGESPLLIIWLCCVQCTPKCSLPFWLPGHTAGSCWACCQLHPQDFSCWATLQPLVSQSVPVPGITPSQGQHLAFFFVELHAVSDLPVFPLQSLVGAIYWYKSFCTDGSFRRKGEETLTVVGVLSYSSSGQFSLFIFATHRS